MKVAEVVVVLGAEVSDEGAEHVGDEVFAAEGEGSGEGVELALLDEGEGGV